MLWMAPQIALTSERRLTLAASAATAGSSVRRNTTSSSSSLRCRARRAISSSIAPASSAGSRTKVPPLRPRRASTSWSASSSRMACWMVGRPTPNIAASSRSDGSASPGWTSRSAMWRRICSATYSCARRGCIGSNWARSRERRTSTATHGLLGVSRHALQEGVEEAPGRLARLRRALVGLVEETLRVHAVLLELVRVGAHPRLHDLGSHLGVELRAEAAPDRVCLRPDVALGDQLGAVRQREAVEVPLEPRAVRHERLVAGAHRQPADLGLVRAEGAAAGDLRE